MSRTRRAKELLDLPVVDRVPSLQDAAVQLLGLQVRTGSGKALGIIEDILFDSETGRLEGMEISRGLFQDFVDGRVTIPMPDVYTVGQDAVVVPEEIGKRFWAQEPGDAE